MDKAKQAKIDQFVEQKCVAGAEQLMDAVKFGGTDGIVAVIDSIATIHATILMRYYESDDWQQLMQSYHANVADKIVAVGEALTKELADGNPAHH